MTDDIVTRLRDTAYETDICWEAAAEIERLREQVAEYRNLYLLRSRLGDAVGGV